MTISTTGIQGISAYGSETSLIYMYGLSDFWSSIFQDPGTIEAILTASSVELSEVYSRFLQLTSSISLYDIQTVIKSQISLVVLKSTDVVPGSNGLEYYLDKSYLKSRYICNRPFLPTETLEEGIHFTFLEGGAKIRFSDLISEHNFPVRSRSEGVQEYALWLMDTEADENLIYSYFGYLLTSTPETASEQYKAFINGLFFVYANGPTLDLFQKGLNLAMGIPLCRGYERVLDITQYEGSNNKIIITDASSYIVPYGLEPTVEIGDQLYTGSELANWIKVKDYIKDGIWWVGLSMPRALFSTEQYQDIGNPTMIPGNNAEYLMSIYLKTHVFLVQVRVGEFFATEHPKVVGDLLRKVRPTYTYPYYVWSVFVDETLEMEEEFKFIFRILMDETFFPGIDQFDRFSHASRREAVHMRFNCPDWMDRWTNKDSRMYTPREVQLEEGGTFSVVSHIAPKLIYDNEPFKTLWYSSVAGGRSRQGDVLDRSYVRHSRGTRPGKSANTFKYIPSLSGENYSTDHFTLYSMGAKEGDIPTGKLPFNLDLSIPLYVTTEEDLRNKLNTVLGAGQYPWNSSTREFGLVFRFFDGNYNTLFFRGQDVIYLGSKFPPDCYKTYAPTTQDLANIDTRSYLYATRMTSMDSWGVWAVMLVSFSPLNCWRYIQAYTFEDLTISGTGPFIRGSTRLDTPMGYFRGVPMTGNTFGNTLYKDVETTQNTEISMERDTPASQQFKLSYTSRDN